VVVPTTLGVVEMATDLHLVVIALHLVVLEQTVVPSTLADTVEMDLVVV
jgi:hypothetical protein